MRTLILFFAFILFSNAWATSEECLKNYSDEDIINAYTGDLAAFMNDALRGVTSDPKCIERAEQLKNALLKLPPIDNQTVYRGSILTNEFKNLKIGQCIVDPAFLSTSTSWETAVFFSAGMVMEIRSRTGRDISKYSAYGAEKEVLLLPQTLLQYQGEKTNGDKVFNEAEEGQCKETIKVKPEPVLIKYFKINRGMKLESPITDSALPKKCNFSKSCSFELSEGLRLVEWECMMGTRLFGTGVFRVKDEDLGKTLAISCDQDGPHKKLE